MSEADYELKVALVDHSPTTSSTNGHSATTTPNLSPSPPLLAPLFPPSSPPPTFHPPTPLEVASPTGSILPLTAVPSLHRPFLYLFCVCSLFVTFRPSEPYLTQYLMDDKGLGAEAVNERVYPVWTYSYFAFLVPVGLAGEWLGYRAIIGAEFLFLLVTYVILIWAEGLRWMQLMQVTFGFTSAAQSCVFFTYIYQCCPAQLYHTAVAGALVGQVLISTGHGRWQLFLPTLTAIAIATVAFAFLPTPQQQRQLTSPDSTAPLYEDANKAEGDDSSSSSSSLPPSFSLRRLSSVNALSLFSSLFSHLLAQYRRRTVFLFSLYVILGNSVLELLLNYDLSLWYALDPAFDLNGLVLACGWLLSAAAAFLTSLALVVTYVDVHPYLVLSALPALASLLVWASTWTSSVHVACVLFVSFYAVLSFLMVVSSALIASAMSFQAFAFLFSVNTFLSLAVQSLVQLIIGEHGYSMSIFDKYRMFGSQLLLLSALYAVLGIRESMRLSIERRVRGT